jgi:hypothetical protein
VNESRDPNETTTGAGRTERGDRHFLFHPFAEDIMGMDSLQGKESNDGIRRDESGH